MQSMQQPFVEDHAAHAVHGAAPNERQLKALNAEYETDIHFQKCYGVMAELFEAHGYLSGFIPDSGFKFLDLGCAPGGFSSYMLEDPRCRAGFGVSLPSTSGGFPMRLRCNNFFFQQGDLFEIGPTDLLASDVNVCICDAQYLRNNVAWDEKYRGVRCRSKQHGVWALLMKQFWLGMSKLLANGILIFRFGWRDPGPEDIATIWYKKCTLRLFSILHDLFTQVREVKSDHFNALQSSFYVCCAGFDRAKFEEREVARLLGSQFNYLLTTRIQDSNELELLAVVDKIRTQEVDQTISEMLDRVDKLRIIHQQSRRWHHKQETEHEDTRAVLFVSPVPEGMGVQELENFFSVYGIVHRVDVNGSEEASVQFAKVDHAQTAVLALRSSPSFTTAFGDGARVWMRQEEGNERSVDTWAQEWSMTPSVAPKPTSDESWPAQPQPSWAIQGERPAAAEEKRQYDAPPPGFWNEGSPKLGTSVPKGKNGSFKGNGASNGGYTTGKGGETADDSSKGAVRQDRPQRPKESGKGQPQQSVQPQQRPQPTLQQQQRAANVEKPRGGGKTNNGEELRQPSDEQSQPARPVEESKQNQVAERPDLHPALQDHQAKTKELIAQLLKPK